MTDDRVHVTLRPMTLDDIDQVLVLDRLAFPNPWPAHTYRHEIINNRTSTMLVLEHPDLEGSDDAASGSLLDRLMGRRPATEHASYPLVGYSGFWKIADEAHISTIAIHPEWRGHKLGELLIWSMFHLAMQKGARMMTLEVRVTNTVAQNLYHKYGFEITGRRKNYYRDNQEDAHIMTAMPLDDLMRTTLRGFERDLAERVGVTFDGVPLEQSQRFLADKKPSSD